MSPAVQKTIKALIPEHVAGLGQSVFEQLRARWDEMAKLSGGEVPSFTQASDAFLRSLGDFGEELIATRNAYDLVVRQAATYETFAQRLNTEASKNPGTPSNTPWSQVSDRIYVRFMTRGHYGDIGLLQVRVLPATETTARATKLKGTLASTYWLPSFLFKSQTATAEEAPGGDCGVPFDPAGLEGDPGAGGVQPLGLAGTMPMPMPFEGPMNPLAAAAALAAALGLSQMDPKTVAQAMRDIDAAIAGGASAVAEYLAEWLRTFVGLYKPPPPTAPGIFGGLERVPAKSPSYRPRYKDKDGNIYEWDGQHGDLEKYNSRGKKHEGSFDPETGKQTRPPVKGRCAGK
ncbi:hypothetical protein K2X33_07060 [bacterium]|nr:hypothetical protein [bacterium]